MTKQSFEENKAHPDYSSGYTIGIAGGEQITSQSEIWHLGFKCGQEARRLLADAGVPVSVTVEFI